MADGPEHGLRILDGLTARGALEGYHLLPAARARASRAPGPRRRSRRRRTAPRSQLARKERHRAPLPRAPPRCVGITANWVGPILRFLHRQTNLAIAETESAAAPAYSVGSVDAACGERVAALAALAATPAVTRSPLGFMQEQRKLEGDAELDAEPDHRRLVHGARTARRSRRRDRGRATARGPSRRRTPAWRRETGLPASGPMASRGICRDRRSKWRLSSAGRCCVRRCRRPRRACRRRAACRGPPSASTGRGRACRRRASSAARHAPAKGGAASSRRQRVLLGALPRKSDADVERQDRARSRQRRHQHGAVESSRAEHGASVAGVTRRTSRHCCGRRRSMPVSA